MTMLLHVVLKVSCKSLTRFSFDVLSDKNQIRASLLLRNIIRLQALQSQNSKCLK